MQGKFFPKRAAWAASLIVVAGFTVSTPSYAQTAGTVDSIEYFNSRSGQYYRTDVAAEIAAIDQNAVASGWARTGQSYKLWRTQADAPAGAIPLVKMSSLNFATPSSPQVCSLNKIAALNGAPKCAPLTSVTYALMPDANGNCAAGTQPIYQTTVDNGTRFANQLSVYQDMFDRGWKASGVSICVPGVSSVQDADIYRLLKQATFGANEALMNQVKQVGITAWVDSQLNMTAESSMPALPFYPTQRATDCVDGTTPETMCARDNYQLYQIQLRFTQNALSKQDQLRQRVAFALSQILVTSGMDNTLMPYGMAKYQQLMLDYAFGNYKDLLYAVTLSPIMGDYLNMANSNKPDPARGISANENYAREIMQLFSVGLYNLNMDGTVKKDATGNPIPSYSQTTVENLARVFTGWTYANANGTAATRNNPPFYDAPMQAVESNHDVGLKTLTNGFTIPAGQTAARDLGMALDHLFAHPNVAPFISKQLIQRLVTGDPSPEYVARIANVFNNNGQGIKGDLKAVVRAILLDSEARGAIKTAPSFGKLKEPVLFAISAYRGLGSTNDGVWMMPFYAGMGQDLFRAPTVFNYFAPDNAISNGKLGPEFEILTSTTAFARMNFIRNLTSGGVVVNVPVTGNTTIGTYAPVTTVANATGTSVNWAPWQALAANPTALVDKLSWVFAAGAMSQSAQQQIINAVNAIPATDTMNRARLAIYLTLTSNQFQVDR
jgi:uncharacterized protein (DUF1800 family)